LLKAWSHLTRSVEELVTQHTIRDRDTGIDCGAGGTRLFAGLESQIIEKSRSGLLIGLAISFGLVRFIRSLLYGITPADPITLGAAVMVVLMAGALADRPQHKIPGIS
jgi:hypothetical protein